MARRNFGDAAWEDWRSRMETSYATRGWASAWAIFERNRDSIDRQRRALHAARVHDEYWYANEFGLAWPLTLAGSPIPAPAASARPRYDKPCPITASLTVHTATPTKAPLRRPTSPSIDRLPISDPVGAVLVG